MRKIGSRPAAAVKWRPSRVWPTVTAPEWLPVEEKDCKRCDSPGSALTHENQVAMPIRRRVEGIDRCIHRLVAALNAANIETVASCCGHEVIPAMIMLEDGRIIAIFDDWEAAQAAWPGHQWG